MSASMLDGDKQKGLQISKIILARTISSQHIKQLLEDGKTELITGFISKKKRPFDAFLLLNQTGKISFEFPRVKNGKTRPKRKTVKCLRHTINHETTQKRNTRQKWP